MVFRVLVHTALIHEQEMEVDWGEGAVDSELCFRESQGQGARRHTCESHQV